MNYVSIWEEKSRVPSSIQEPSKAVWLMKRHFDIFIEPNHWLQNKFDLTVNNVDK
jgi:hypothetical protein